MKQEIVVKVQMRCDKCRTKAMELVASADGVVSVSLGGEDRNELVVVGDGVDAVGLASILRKKVGPTDITKLGEPKKKNGKNNNGNKGDSDENEKKQKKAKDSGKENNDHKKNGKKIKVEKEMDDEEQQEQYRYQYLFHQQGPEMEYMKVQPHWYPGYPAAYPPPVLVYDSQPTYSNPNCSIM